MDVKLNVLLVSRRRETLDSLEAILRKFPGLRLQRKLTVNGHVDPLHEVSALPEALILHLGETSHAELESVAARAADRRPPLIVVGDSNDTTVMRLAMQAGARDLLPLPLVEADLIASLKRIERDRRAAGAHAEGSLIACMNAKGGCGATLLACNVAHALVAVAHRNVTLVDLDLQFGAIPLYFDLFPKRGMLQALENLDRLDDVALKGYVAQHASGLKVLGNAAEDALPTQPVSVDQLRRLLDVAVRCNDHLIVDLPRRIDAVTALALERAQTIMLVVQQSLATLRDATRLITCMRNDLGVSKDRLLAVINRYDKKSDITVEDIRTTLACAEVFLVPNDFRTVSECVNTGTPLLVAAQNAAISRAILTLQVRLGGVAAEQRGLLARTFSGLRKASST